MNAVGDATMALAFFLLIQRTGSLDFGPGVQWASGAEGGLGGQPRSARTARRSGRQVGADPAPHLVARRDGRPDPRQRPHPRGDDGHCRRLSARAARAALRVRAERSAPGSRPRRDHASGRRPDRARPGRHQASHRLFDDVPDRLHVPRRGSRRLRERDVPPDDARVLQGTALPRRRNRHPRARRRAGHAEDGRAEKTAAADLGRLPDRSSWRSPASRLSRDSGPRIRSSPPRSPRVRTARCSSSRASSAPSSRVSTRSGWSSWCSVESPPRTCASTCTSRSGPSPGSGWR